MFVCLSVHQCLTTFGPHLDQKTETNFCIETSLGERRERERKKEIATTLFILSPTKKTFISLINHFLQQNFVETFSKSLAQGFP